MLEASRSEIEPAVDDDERGVPRLAHGIVIFVVEWVWEPLCTGLRFLHLAAIFAPAILAVPAIWIGRRRPDRGNETTGALWWYGVLVRSLEMAGPSFIKVRARQARR